MASISLLTNLAVEEIADLDVTYLAAHTAAERISSIFIHYHLGLLPGGLYNQSRSLLAGDAISCTGGQEFWERSSPLCFGDFCAFAF